MGYIFHIMSFTEQSSITLALMESKYQLADDKIYSVILRFSRKSRKRIVVFLRRYVRRGGFDCE